MSRRPKTVFEQPKGEYEFNPEKKHTKFYQVCYFPSPWTNKRGVRRFIIDEMGVILNISEYGYTEKQFKEFFNKHRPNEYTIYSTNDIKTVDYPTDGKLQEALSSILSNDNSYTGFATF